MKELQGNFFWLFIIKEAKWGYLKFTISMSVEGEGQVPRLFSGLAIFNYKKNFTVLVMEIKNQSEITFLSWENRLEKQKLLLVVALILCLKQTDRDYIVK